MAAPYTSKNKSYTYSFLKNCESVGFNLENIYDINDKTSITSSTPESDEILKIINDNKKIYDNKSVRIDISKYPQPVEKIEINTNQCDVDLNLECLDKETQKEYDIRTNEYIDKLKKDFNENSTFKINESTQKSYIDKNNIKDINLTSELEKYIKGTIGYSYVINEIILRPVCKTPCESKTLKLQLKTTKNCDELKQKIANDVSEYNTRMKLSKSFGRKQTKRSKKQKKRSRKSRGFGRKQTKRSRKQKKRSKKLYI